MFTRPDVSHLATDTPVDTPTPPDVAAVLEDVERLHRINYAYTLVYRIRNDRDYQSWPSPNEVALRLGGKFPGGIQLHLPLAEHAVATVQNRPPEQQPSKQGKLRSKRRNARRSGYLGAQVRWAPTITARAQRDDAIIAARAAGQSAIKVAAEYDLTRQHIGRIATPDAVAAWREQNVTLAISPVNQDDSLFNQYKKTSLSAIVDSQCYIRPNKAWHLPDNWLLDIWTEKGAPLPAPDKVWKIIQWGDDADRCSIPNENDLARLVRWASTARFPWKHLEHEVSELYRLTDNGEDLAYLRRTAPDAAVRMVEVPGYVKNPRAYLATSIRDARAAKSRTRPKTGGMADFATNPPRSAPSGGPAVGQKAS